MEMIENNCVTIYIINDNISLHWRWQGISYNPHLPMKMINNNLIDTLPWSNHDVKNRMKYYKEISYCNNLTLDNVSEN